MQLALYLTLRRACPQCVCVEILYVGRLLFSGFKFIFLTWFMTPVSRCLSSEVRACYCNALPTTDHISLAIWSTGSFSSLKSQLTTYLPEYLIINWVAGFFCCWNTEWSMSWKDDSVLDGNLLVDRYGFGFLSCFYSCFYKSEDNITPLSLRWMPISK